MAHAKLSRAHALNTKDCRRREAKPFKPLSSKLFVANGNKKGPKWFPVLFWGVPYYDSIVEWAPEPHSNYYGPYIL